jgi:C4-dicarboxylate-specific signal transduction histidine kinase
MQQQRLIVPRTKECVAHCVGTLVLLTTLLLPPAIAIAEQNSRPEETRVAVSASSLAEPQPSDLRPASWSPVGAPALQASQQYLLYILLGATAVFFQGMLISSLLRERAQRRRSDAQARDTSAQLAHLNRIATAGELSASIAHELTQPITGMVASANAALRWLSAPTPQIEQARSAVARVISAGDRTTEIIHGVRAMFKREAEDRQAIDVNQLILDVLALVDSELRNNEIAVETALGEPPAPVTGDHVQLQQVILNLTVNAISSMTAVKSRVRTLRVSTSYTADRVWVSVADVGTGVSREEMDQIFKPLYTTKRHGMGMGLSICRSIVEAHKGRIWVSPGEPHGAVFHFVLPLG